MYSLILMAGMTAAPVDPSAFPRATGCTGAAAYASAGCVGTRAAPVRGMLATANATRPHVFGRVVAAHKANVAARHSTGCVGSCGVSVKVQATGCAGGGYARMPAMGTQTVVTVAPVAPAAPQAVGGPFNRDHRAIKRFLANHGAPQAKLDAAEVKFGASGSFWMGAVMAFIRGGLPELLRYLTENGV